MDTFENNLQQALQAFLGYPCYAGYDYKEVIKFFNIHINNVGDPRHTGKKRQDPSVGSEYCQIPREWRDGLS